MKRYRLVQKKDYYYIEQQYNILGIKWWDSPSNSNLSSIFTNEKLAIEGLDKMIEYDLLPKIRIIKEYI